MNSSRRSWRWPSRLLLSFVATGLPCAAPSTDLTAQTSGIRGYVLNAGVAASAGPLSDGGVTDFTRVRLMSTPSLGPLTLDLAYEHVLTVREDRFATLFAGPTLGLDDASNQWIDLEGTLVDREHGVWIHRVDRLAVAFNLGERTEVRLGRQTISWATTLFFTPADPFQPFDPADPFREFRGGVDAARVRFAAGPFTELDGVVRLIDDQTGHGSTTALLRGQTLWGDWEVSAWGGALFGEAVGSVGLSGAVGRSALRAEGSVRRDGRDGREAGEGNAAGENDKLVGRFAVGLDRRLGVGGRDLYVVLEYQYDGFGASSERELGAVAVSAPVRRGELQALGRHVVAGQATLQVHPLVGVDLLVLASLSDGSALLAPGLSYSAGSEASVRLGLYHGLGDEPALVEVAPGLDIVDLRSEFGLVPTTLYASLSWFF